MSLFRLAILCGLTSASCFGQLFLITGSPNPKGNETFAVALVRVDDAGALAISEIIPQRTGTEWMAMSRDFGKFLILPSSPDRQIRVVDLNKAAVVKQCEMLGMPNNVSLIEQWLMNLPGRGPSFVEFVARDTEAGNQWLLGMSLDPSVPCDKSSFELTMDQIRHVVADGTGGIAGMGSHDSLSANMDDSGRLLRRMPGLEVSLGYQVPSELLGGVPRPGARMACNNSEVAAFVFSNTRGGRQILAYRKRDRSWHRVPVQSGVMAWVRAFGGFIAVAEGWAKGGPLKESAGRGAWRPKSGPRGPSVADRLRDSEYVFPGRLHLYDVEREKAYMIDTKQADSEILLVDRNLVYYRAGASLYSAEITDHRIGTPRLMAESEEIRDAHWAFFRR